MACQMYTKGPFMPTRCRLVLVNAHLHLAVAMLRCCCLLLAAGTAAALQYGNLSNLEPTLPQRCPPSYKHTHRHPSAAKHRMTMTLSTQLHQPGIQSISAPTSGRSSRCRS